MPSAGQAFPATIVSGGPGATYSATITGIGTVTVVAGYIDSTETVPAGSAIIAVYTGSGYVFQPPVFAPNG